MSDPDSPRHPREHPRGEIDHRDRNPEPRTETATGNLSPMSAPSGRRQSRDRTTEPATTTLSRGANRSSRRQNGEDDTTDAHSDSDALRQLRVIPPVAPRTTAGAWDSPDAARPAENAAHGSAIRQDAAALHGHPLPMVQLVDREPKTRTELAVTRMDLRGRLADRAPLMALRWLPGQAVSFAADARRGVLFVRRGGLEAVNGQGRLRIPARLRHSLQLSAGERLLVAALTEHDLLIVHTMAAVDAMLLAYHLNPTGGRTDER
jgi:hypothetical protein